MLIKVLVENTAVSDDFRTEHGLSLYVETGDHRILFDLGKSRLFLENAQKMGVDIESVDIVVISHGHYDHGGGLKHFLSRNTKAKIYLNEHAFEKHYSRRKDGEITYAGLDENLLPNDRFIFTGECHLIDEGLKLLSGVRGKRYSPVANETLLMESDGYHVQDDFIHEQNLVIREGNRMLLIAGCSHKGIVNIVDHVREKEGRVPDAVIGGFHLHNPAWDTDEDPDRVREIGRYLESSGPTYYTCHCTGMESYGILKEVMGGEIQYLATGAVLTL